MADSKITALTEDTAPVSTDITVTVDDPGGTPVNKKATLANVITKAHGLSDGIVKVASSTMAVASDGTDYISSVAADTTPQLGGSLDVNGNKIVSVSNGNIDIEPNGTGNVLIGNLTIDADQTVGAGQDNYVLKYDNGTGLVSLEAEAAGGISNVVEDTTPQLGGDLDMNGNQITSPDGTDLIDIPNGSIDLQTASTSRLDISDTGVRLGAANARVTTILDEDTMSSDSATALATQQSIKAYVDANAGGGGDTELLQTRVTWNARVNSTTTDVMGANWTAVATTTTANTIAAGSFPITSYPSITYQTSASTGQSTSLRTNELVVARGISGFSNVAGGFKFFTRLAFSGSTDYRLFIGLQGATGVIADVDPSSLTDIIGIGCDTADTNLQVMHNDGSGTATKVDLGSNFAKSAYGLSYHYEITLSCDPGGSNSITYNIDKYTDSNTTFNATGTLTTDLPSTSTAMKMILNVNNATNATAVWIRPSLVTLTFPLL